MLGRPKGDSRQFFWFSATQLARVCLQRATAGTSQLKFSMSNLLHGDHSWKRQRPFKDEPHDDDDGFWFLTVEKKQLADWDDVTGAERGEAETERLEWDTGWRKDKIDEAFSQDILVCVGLHAAHSLLTVGSVRHCFHPHSLLKEGCIGLGPLAMFMNFHQLVY